jgi:hypothetical protein
MTKVVTRMTIHDAGHYSKEQIEEIIAGYPEHERDARAKGIPVLGSGRIFPVTEESIIVQPFPIPSHFSQINGLDFGWDHPQACVNLAHDRDDDVVYVCKAYKKPKTTPEIASIAIRPWGNWIPTAWPHDGYQHDKGSGKELAEQYRSAGLNMLNEHATHSEGGNGVEAGLMQMLDRMQSGRFKVFSTLSEWFDEFRLYHRVDGKVVKEYEDLLCATRYAIMMLRRAELNNMNYNFDISEGVGI